MAPTLRYQTSKLNDNGGLLVLFVFFLEGPEVLLSAASHTTGVTLMEWDDYNMSKSLKCL